MGGKRDEIDGLEKFMNFEIEKFYENLDLTFHFSFYFVQVLEELRGWITVIISVKFDESDLKGEEGWEKF